MSRKLRIEYPNAFYHVYSRGIKKENIFLDQHDFNTFIKICRTCYTKHPFYIHSYCLMPNHYHLFIQTPEPNLSVIMKFINQNYAQYFNEKHSRVGPVFQGRYNGILVQESKYAITLSRYIHRNPVKANLVKSIEDWQWSSFTTFIHNQSKEPFLKTDFILKLFDNNLDNFIMFSNSDNTDNSDSKLFNEPRVILGDCDFRNKFKAKIANCRADEGLRGVIDFKTSASDKCINNAKSFVEKLNLDTETKNNLLMYLLHKESTLNLSDIGILFGQLSAAATRKRISRFKKRLYIDQDLRNYLASVPRPDTTPNLL